jgi:glutamyl/glutaminyl-tRNA synthetase
VRDQAQYLKIIAAARERSTLLPELAEYARMFLNPNPLSGEDLALVQSDSSKLVLTWWREHLEQIDTDNPDNVNAMTQQAIEELGIKGKNFYMPLRLALIGQAHGPDLPTIFAILGKDILSIRLSI